MNPAVALRSIHAFDHELIRERWLLTDAVRIIVAFSKARRSAVAHRDERIVHPGEDTHVRRGHRSH